MKTLKFRHDLVALVRSGAKYSTWRLYDDKNLSVEDEIELLEFGKTVPFGFARVTKVLEKPFEKLTADDKQGHEAFRNNKEMYATYAGYYNTEVNKATMVKIVWFELTDSSS